MQLVEVALEDFLHELAVVIVDDRKEVGLERTPDRLIPLHLEENNAEVLLGQPCEVVDDLAD